MIEKKEKYSGPVIYEDWIDLGRIIIPCLRGKPVVKRWSDPSFKVTKEEWKKNYLHCEIALRLDRDIDLDIDNTLVKRFVDRYVKSCSAVSGRAGNPESHYWWKGEIEFTQYKLPGELKEKFKNLPHGSMLCELRHGHDRYTIVPGSKHSKADENVRWERYAGLNGYTGDLREDVGKVALSTALCLLYAPQGQRDAYCTAIAGVLLKHTQWDVNEIDEFIYNIAIAANDDEALKRRSKGSSGKNANKNLGLPKLAEIIGCSPRAVAELFSWVGIKYAAGKEIAQESIGDITEYGSDRYIVKVNTFVEGEIKEKEIIVDGPTLTKQQMFYDEIIRQASLWVPKMKPKDFETIMRQKYLNRKRAGDYVEEAEEDYKFKKYFSNYLNKQGVYMDKSNLAVYKLPYFNDKNNSLEFNLDHFEDELEKNRINLPRVDLVLKVQRVLKAKKYHGKHDNKSCVSWKVDGQEVDKGALLIEGEYVEITGEIKNES